MKILVASLIRDRAWILSEYLNALLQMGTNEIEYYFLVNDSSDASIDILHNFKQNNRFMRDRITIEEVNIGTPKDARNCIRVEKVYLALAKLRNKIIDFTIGTDAEYLFSIDSDIIVKKDCLTKLLEVDSDVVSALIYNDYGRGNIGNVMAGLDNPKHIDFKEQQDIFECDITGACVLIKREVLMNKKCRYGYDRLGEDIPFCRAVKQEGFDIYSRKGLAEHKMRSM